MRRITNKQDFMTWYNREHANGRKPSFWLEYHMSSNFASLWVMANLPEKPRQTFFRLSRQAFKWFDLTELTADDQPINIRYFKVNGLATAVTTSQIPDKAAPIFQHIQNQTETNGKANDKCIELL